MADLVPKKAAQEALFSMAVTALRYAYLYDESNPEVGMGPSTEMLLLDVIRSSGLSFSEQSKREVLQRYNDKYDDIPF